MTTARRAPIFGPEPWAAFADVEWSHFDRWFVLVAAGEFAADLDALERDLVARLRSSLHGRRDLEAKLSHLTDLRERMTAAGVDVTALASSAEPDVATMTKARRKVLDQALEDRAMTAAMRDTPHVRLQQRARHGHWERFPVNPSRWYERLAGRRATTFVPTSRTHTVCGQLRDRLSRADGPRRDLADRLALYRAFHTAGLDLADRADDSYGDVGQLRVDAFATYLDIDWSAAGMPAEHYWQDLCELLVAEPYALTHEQETLPFRRVRAVEAPMVEAVLLGLAREYRTAYHDYHADQALQLIAWMHLAGRRYLAYTDAARRLGSDHWRPIQTLAESAIAGGRPDVAVAVFRAADQPGMHQELLRQRCFQITGVRLDSQAPQVRVTQ